MELDTYQESLRACRKRRQEVVALIQKLCGPREVRVFPDISANAYWKAELSVAFIYKKKDWLEYLIRILPSVEKELNSLCQPGEKLETKHGAYWIIASDYELCIAFECLGNVLWSEKGQTYRKQLQRLPLMNVRRYIKNFFPPYEFFLPKGDEAACLKKVYPNPIDRYVNLLIEIGRAHRHCRRGRNQKVSIDVLALPRREIKDKYHWMYASVQKYLKSTFIDVG